MQSLTQFHSPSFAPDANRSRLDDHSATASQIEFSGAIRRAVESPTSSIPQEGPDSPPAETLRLDWVIQNHVRLILELNRGNKLRTARQLGISRSTLYRFLAIHAIPAR